MSDKVKKSLFSGADWFQLARDAINNQDWESAHKFINEIEFIFKQEIDRKQAPRSAEGLEMNKSKREKFFEMCGEWPEDMFGEDWGNYIKELFVNYSLR